jgi:hypothetical protein
VAAFDGQIFDPLVFDTSITGSGEPFPRHARASLSVNGKPVAAVTVQSKAEGGVTVDRKHEAELES